MSKRCDIHVAGVGAQAFAAEIDSPQGAEMSVDLSKIWRAGVQLMHRPHELPDDAAARCVERVARLGV